MGGGREKPVGNLLLPLIRSHLAHGAIEPFVYHLRNTRMASGTFCLRFAYVCDTTSETSAWRAAHFA